MELACAEFDAFVAEVDLRCVDAILFHYKIEYLCSNGEIMNDKDEKCR